MQETKWGGNKRLHHSKKEADDEFYTRLQDIQKTLPDFHDKLQGKSIYLPCDNKNSQFVQYFQNNGMDIGISQLNFSSLEDGCDFLSDTIKQRMLESDVIITNPPYSRLKEFLKFLDNYHKDFLIIASVNSLHYIHTFEMIKDRRLFIHKNALRCFDRPDGSVGNATSYWLTSFPLPDYPKLDLSEVYEKDKYPEYDNLKIIEVSAFKLIPKDYREIMGVPASFLPKLNREQFDLLGLDKDVKLDNPFWNPYCKRGFKKHSAPILNGKQKYSRIYIRHKNHDQE